MVSFLITIAFQDDIRGDFNPENTDMLRIRRGFRKPVIPTLKVVKYIIKKEIEDEQHGSKRA
jgi:hypothetical protein